MKSVLRFFLEQRLVVAACVLALVVAGALVVPFDWDVFGLPRAPVAVDAIPDIGENQQIVFTPWPGRSPQDIDDQVTYPLTSSLLGLPKVKTIRSQSILGFSTIYIIFDESADFYESRSRILEKLNSLSQGTLPDGVVPTLGPDATALGQVYWYTLEGRSPEGVPVGGWDLDELRSLQDWTVRYGIMAADGVSEVASIGGFVREYQVDVDPDALRGFGVTLDQVVAAVRQSNLDVGAQTIEINRAEYLVRGLGLIESLEDLENVAVAQQDYTPVLLRDVATVGLGPASRRGVLDKGGAEAVGGVVVARHGGNPMQVVQNVKQQIEKLQLGLPSRTLSDGTVSQVTIVPFYDRSELIEETLGTLSTAIEQQMLITLLIVLLLVLNLRSGILISAMLPLAVLATFLGMKLLNVEANIVALSGIAIAVGTIVDMGIVLSENILRRLEDSADLTPPLQKVLEATVEVGGAILIAVMTTIVSFLPVFAMQGAEGKLFTPLAYTKTLALVASIGLSLLVLPAMAFTLLRPEDSRRWLSYLRASVGLLIGLWAAIYLHVSIGAVVVLAVLVSQISKAQRPRAHRLSQFAVVLVASVVLLWILAERWAPLGVAQGTLKNFLFISVGVALVWVGLYLFSKIYVPALTWLLGNKLVVLLPSLLLMAMGMTVWLGFADLFSWLPESVRSTRAMRVLDERFPGLGREFMPSLNEGSFLYMPTAMTHASIAEATEVLQRMDAAIATIPEVLDVVGKIGRAESALDPAPLSMVETMITYHPEFIQNPDGTSQLFRVDRDGAFTRDSDGQLIPSEHGRPFRNWREQIRTADDIWDEIVTAAQIPGVTSAPKLQPIETRRVMLQSGFRAPIGLKVYGPDLDSIDRAGLQLEALLKQVPSVDERAVFADRVVGKPYLEIDVDRTRLARYGIQLATFQSVIEVAIGGKRLSTSVEGRERYPVRVRYQRELRDSLEAIQEILIPAADGTPVPLRELAKIEYERGPQMVRSENTFLVGYVLLDARAGFAEVDVVEEAQAFLEEARQEGRLILPEGVRYEFAGAYENQVRASKRLRLVLPAALLLIALLLYLHFRSVPITLIVFSGVFVAWSGGFLMLWLYAQDGFLNFDVFGVSMRELFQIGPVNLSVAVWVGFLALFGIATDDGVVMGTRLRQAFAGSRPDSLADIRRRTVQAGSLRMRACLMTTATTLLALMPILTSQGRGADIMLPMAIPTFGGMTVALLTLFLVPVLHCTVEEFRWATRSSSDAQSAGGSL